MLTVPFIRRPTRVLLLLMAILLGAVGTVGGARPVHASGVPYALGDVFADVGNGQVQHFSSTGVLLDTLSGPATGAESTGMAFDLAGNLYATQFGNQSVYKFDNAGNFVSTFGGGYNSDPESIERDFFGNFYVGHADGSHQIRKFDSSGTFLTSFSPNVGPRGTDWIDIAANQCTVLYTSEGKVIRSFDVCTNTQLPDFATLPINGINPGIDPNGSVAYALRIRPNGEVLVAASKQVFRLDSLGNVIQTYSGFPGSPSVLFALNLDADLTSFWTGDNPTGRIYRVDIASGAILTQFTSAHNPSLGGIAVFGEITAAQPSLALSPANASQTIGLPITLTAQLMNVVNPAGIVVTFTVSGVNPQVGMGTADASGTATFTYTGAHAGVDTVVATATAVTPPASLTSNTATITWNKAPTNIVYNGDTTGDFNDQVTAAATLTSGGSPLANELVQISLNGTDNCSGTTDALGNVSCFLTPSEVAGTYGITASFAGDADHLPASDTAHFVVTLEETTTTYTGPLNIPNGTTVVLSGRLLEDGISGIANRNLTLTLGSGGSAQSCIAGPTDVNGNASCTIVNVNQPLGPGTITASFAGDGFYRPSRQTVSTLTFAFLGSGAFVIGDGNSATGSSVTYWGAHWSTSNSLSGGSAPASFKGFADGTGQPPQCGAGWTSDPGNSSGPPDSVPQYMAVIVASSVHKSGSTESGDTVHIVIVKTDPGYASNPGHAGTGTVVATLC